MASTPDPIRQWRRRSRWTWTIGAAALLPMAWWALTPPDRPVPVWPSLDLATMVEPESEAPQPLVSASAFDVQLWNEPPQAMAAELLSESSPPPHPDLELLGIIEEAGARFAAVYDRRADCLVIVKSGDRLLDRFEVTNIEEGSLDLTDGSRTLRLALATTATVGHGNGGSRP